MSATPTPAPAAPLWHDTHAGRCEAWIHRLIFNGQREPDYQDAQEFMGAKCAARMMHAVEDYGQCCPNHAPSAR